MQFLLTNIQIFVNLLFVVVIAGTLIVSWVFADRLKKRHSADFPWGKALSIVGIEVLVFIGFNIFFEIFKANWFWITIGTIILLIIISSIKSKKYR